MELRRLGVSTGYAHRLLVDQALAASIHHVLVWPFVRYLQFIVSLVDLIAFLSQPALSLVGCRVPVRVVFGSPNQMPSPPGHVFARRFA